jgi:hypothetical protein
MTSNLLRADQARLNNTWAGDNGDLPDAVGWDLDDEQIRQIALESIRSGSVPGIAADRDANLTDFVVDRFGASDDVPYHRLFVRPKTPFGA